MGSKHCVWENTTSYKQGEDKTEVRKTSLTAGEFRIIVTRYVGFDKELVMHCAALGISVRTLDTEDMEEGQQKALKVADSAVKRIAYAIDQAMRINHER